MKEGRKRFPAPPPSELTRHRISKALKGKAKSPEHCEAMSEALKGKKRSPEQRERIRAGRLAYLESQKPEAAYLACRKARWERLKRESDLRLNQKKLDMLKALQAGKIELALDIRQSWGWWVKRKMHDPLVSDGYSRKFKRVMDYPYLNRLRAESGRGPINAQARKLLEKTKRDGKT